MKHQPDDRKTGKAVLTILVLSYVSHFLYYYGVFTKKYPEVEYLAWIALLALTFGFFFGLKYKFILRFRGNNRQANKKLVLHKKTFSYQQQKAIAILMIAIGIFSHILFYRNHSFGSYAEGYGMTRGNGYITVFFNFWLVGMIIIEYLTENGLINRQLKWVNRALMIVYCLVYFVILTKRRQIIILLLALLGIWKDKIPKFQKILLYSFGIVLVLVFSIFGKVRGFVDVNGFSAGLGYAMNNFSWDWISPEQFEGRYIARTLHDVASYVKEYGFDPSILLGVIFCMIPRKLLGGTKPLAFPEWYTKHFFLNDFLRGTGYAGSFIAELYLIGGVLVLIIGYFCVGYISARIQKLRSHSDSIRDTLVYSLYLYTILVLPRYDLASLLIDVVFMYLPIVWFCGRNFTEEMK